MQAALRRSTRAGCVAVILLLSACGGDEPSYPSGSLEATEIDLAPAIAGRVLAVRPRLGDRVAPGDTLVVLDTRVLALQREQSLAALASLDAQQAVSAADLQAAERSRALAATTLERVRALHERGSASAQQLDDALAARDVAASRASAARHRLEAYPAERDRLVAVIAVTDRQLEDGALVAPVAGTVLMRAIEAGETAVPGVPALRIADLSRLELRVYLEAESLDRVRLGQDIRVRVDALGGPPLRGRVAWISAEAEFTPKNAQTRDARAQLVYAVKIEVPNPDGRLHIGMTAEAEI